MNQGLKYMDEINLRGKRVFIRVDFNVPLDENGNITDDTRIRGVLPTINYALDENAKVILASHLGRPKGKRVPEMSLSPVAKRLGRLLEKEVTLAPDCIGTACLGPPPAPPVSCDEPGTVCIPRCDGGGKCPEYSAAPVVAESSFDPTPTAQGAERIWVNYYVDRGSVTSDLQLIAAATPGVGWLTEYSTKVVAPAEPGPMLLWSVVRDSRGGQNWTRLKVLVE